LIGEREGRAVVEAVVHDLLAERAPEELPDLPLVFGTVYRAAELRLDAIEPSSGPSEGLPFDTSFLAGTALSAAVWVACSLLRVHRLRATADQRASLVRRLGEEAGSESIVKDLKSKIDELLAALRDLGRDLDTRESKARSELRHLQSVEAGAGPRFDAEPPIDGFEIVDRDPTPGIPSAELILLAARRGPVGSTFLLSYRLLGSASSGDPIHLHSSPCLLKRDPGPHIATILEAGGAGPSSVRIHELGVYLGKRLLPPDLLDVLRPLAGCAATLQVISEEPAIPWEILRLPAPADRVAEPAPFLADAFVLSQWSAKGSPPMRLSARRIAVVSPEDSGLPAVAEEVEILHRLAADGGREVVRVPARYDSVCRALSSGAFDVVHFSGHGVAPGQSPESWTLILEGGERLTSVDVVAAAGSLGSRSPLVFLNACLTAREGWALTGIGGLAVAFLEAGAGAVIGTHWAVPDGAARVFAEDFYHHFLAGAAIADAVRRARRRLRDAAEVDPTWLAYTVYAHPQARCFSADP
jgi:hypothetical protein